MKQIFFLLLFSTHVSLVFAQSGSKISGVVKESGGKQISAATVSLLNSKDSGLLKTAVANKEGLFEFVQIKNGGYFVSVSAVGYKKIYSKKFDVQDGDVVMDALALDQTNKDLGGVTVTAQRPFVETKIDRTVVNVEASPTSAGATALDILEKSPGVMINQDGLISLRGKEGVIVMMDGKQTFLSPADLTNLLRNTPASALDQIEIMTNPSSKFDAAGNSGIINIKTKKGRAAGFNGSVMIGATTSIYNLDGKTLFIPKSQNSFNFNYRKNKINFFGNYNPNFFRGRNTMHFDTRFLNNDKELTGYGTTDTRFIFKGDNHTLKMGIDVFANKKNVFGVVVSGFTFLGRPRPTTVADLFSTNGQLESRLVSSTENQFRFKNFTGNINWKHNFDSLGKELTMDFDYVKYSSETDMLLTTDYYDGNLQSTGRTLLKGNLPSEIDIYSFKSDFVMPVKDGRFEAGVKISYVNNDNLVDYGRSFDEKTWERDNIRSNHFIYKENINAGYVTYNKKIKKWTVQGGLRVENTIGEGHQIVSNTKFRRDTTNLFPTAFVSYALSDKNTFTVNYGRRITRPNYQDLNPFIFFLDTLSYRRGNIYLKPQLTHNVELTHAFKGKFITTLNYNHTDNVISQIVKPESGFSKIRFLTVDNVASFRNIGLALTTPVTFTKWWNTNIFTNVFNNRFKGMVDTFAVDVAFTSFTINVTNNFTIAKGFTAELSGFYRHKGLNNLSIAEPVYQMGFGLQKQIMKTKGTIRLNVRDPFAWQVFRGLNKYGLTDSDYSIRPDIRQVTATFTWRFGSNGQNNQPRRRAGSSEDEQGRAGQGNQ